PSSSSCYNSAISVIRLPITPSISFPTILSSEIGLQPLAVCCYISVLPGFLRTTTPALQNRFGKYSRSKLA
ncbi:hypothetical protein OIDMADRAFT_132107, partial [Oidiodendron maius Zn]